MENHHGRTIRIILDADVIHMDDFSCLRLAAICGFEPGGNVIMNGFRRSVALSQIGKLCLSYLDCDNDLRERIIAAKVRIVEGAYSLHPFFGNYADLKVFSDIEPDEQINRILKRNGEKMAEIFRARWIPLEEQYFSECRVPARADIVV